MVLRKHIIQNFFSRVCFLGSTFLVNIYFTRLLGAAGSGELYYAINNYSVIVLLSSLSLESAMTYFLSKNEIADRELVALSIIWTIIAGTITSVSFLLLQHQYLLTSEYNSPLYSFVYIAGNLLTTYFSALFFARQKFLYPLFIPAITNFIIAIIGWSFLRYGNKDIRDIIIRFYFFSFILNGIILAIIYRFNFPFRFQWELPSKQIIKKLWGYSAIAFVANLVSFFALRIDYWILKVYVPVSVTINDFGNYVQVAKLVQVFLISPTIIATVVFPVSASGTGPSFELKFRKMISNALLLNIAACILLLFTGMWAFPFIFGNGFDAMYSCFIYSIPGILALTIVRILAAYFAGKNQIKFNLRGSLIALFIIAGLNILLIPLMGINGAAVADSAGYLAYMVYLIILFRKWKIQ